MYGVPRARPDHLAHIWDENNLLRVHDDASIELHPFEKVKVFNAMKNSLQDRQIGDRRGRNSVEARVQGDSVNLPSGLTCLTSWFPLGRSAYGSMPVIERTSIIKSGQRKGDQGPTLWVRLWTLPT